MFGFLIKINAPFSKQNKIIKTELKSPTNESAIFANKEHSLIHK